MNIAMTSTIFTIPETAPFTPGQREWLSEFLITMLAPNGGDIPSGAEQSLGPALASNDDAPWHDPALKAEDRLKLAESRPLAPRLMAAMAQQDCGQCGYTCADYANAIFLKSEARLNLCAPGGKETARLIKKFAAELDGAEPVAKASREMGVAPTAKLAGAASPGPSREQPAEAILLSRRCLNGDGSEKDTWHIEIDIANSGLAYEVGDSFGIFPENDLGLVDQIIAMLGAAHTTEVRGRELRDVLLDEVSLGIAPDSLYELFSFICGGSLRQKARSLAQGEDPDGDAAQLDVLAALQKFLNARPHPEAFVDALEPLHPRLYSICSSPKAQRQRLALTVDAVRYVIGKRKRLGVASTFLIERAKPGAPIKAYVQKAHDFSLPDPTTPIIMIGPGTGIAPFRAFLHERQAAKAPGKNWMFFGHQRQAADFFYRDELTAFKESGLLSRLSLAWSRDGHEKYYVQDRMREVGAELWQWLAQGAHVYVCGDAKRMAKDVEATLVEIVATHGVRSTDEAIAFVTQLKKAGRYQTDVY